MLEAAAGQEDRQVRGVVTGGVAHVAAKQDHRAVEQGFAFLLRLLELGEQLAEGLHQLQFQQAKLRHFLRPGAMVRQAVVPFLMPYARHGLTAVDPDGDQPRRIGLERQWIRSNMSRMCSMQSGLYFTTSLGGGASTFGFGFAPTLPLSIQPLFHVAHGQ